MAYYINLYSVCKRVCLCVCVRERERERESVKKLGSIPGLFIYLLIDLFLLLSRLSLN